MLDAKELAKRLRDAMDNHHPRLLSVELAEKCGVTPQAVNGWRETGRIHKRHLPMIVRETGKSIEYFLDDRQGKSKMRFPWLKTPERLNDPHAHVVLKRLYEERVPKGMTQEQFGAMHGIGTQGMVWQYLNGETPLPLEAAAKFAKALRCTIYDISPPLAEMMKADIIPFLGPKSWWRLASKPAALALLAILALPPSPSHASFSSHVAASVYYVKSWLRRFWTELVRIRTGFCHAE